MEAQQQQPQQYHYQYQTYTDANPAPAAPLSYDPSHVQSYDQSTQSYYSYTHQDYSQSQPQPQSQSQHDYSSYYYPDYSNSYQTQHVQSDPNSIHPPGVPIAADTQQSHLQNAPELYYQHGVPPAQTLTPQSQGYMLPGHSTTYGASRGGRGHGRGGRGGMRKPKPAPVKPPPQKAWCELCKVDCNTQEILQQHLNGKKHKKNLKVQEELKNMTQKNPETPASQPNPAEGAAGNNETTQPPPSSGAPSSENPILKKDHPSAKRGLKRDIKGVGRGGKRMKPNNGSRKPPVEPPKSNPNPNLRFPVICELCNVKCESQVVYDSHMAGKKHLANANQFPGHKQPPPAPLLGGLQALYPAATPSTSITAAQLQQQGPQDAQSLAAMILSQQNLQDPQAAQAALTQLLHQHGIHDAQTLLIQLIPYLLTQSQVVPGSAPELPLPGLAPALGALNAQNPEIQAVQSKPEEQNAVEANAEAQQDGTPKTDKVDANES